MPHGLLGDEENGDYLEHFQLPRFIPIQNIPSNFMNWILSSLFCGYRNKGSKNGIARSPSVLQRTASILIHV